MNATVTGVDRFGSDVFNQARLLLDLQRINHSLAKLQTKNRYQAVYQAAIQGWIYEE